MKRQKGLTLLSCLVLAGCGGGGKPPEKKAPAKVVKQKKAEKREKDEARKRIDESDLPADAKKELKEAQDLLEKP